MISHHGEQREPGRVPAGETLASSRSGPTALRIALGAQLTMFLISEQSGETHP
jgi:hypothetical protein